MQPSTQFNWTVIAGAGSCIIDCPYLARVARRMNHPTKFLSAMPRFTLAARFRLPSGWRCYSTAVSRAHFFYGPMGSGKTSRLIRHVREVQDLVPNIELHAYRPSIDTRAPPGLIVSRDGSILENVKTFHHCNEIDSLENSLVVIDEVHFCDDTLFEVFDNVLNARNSSIALAGLDLDFRGRHFGPMLRLVEYAEQTRQCAPAVHVLRSMCYVCGEDAPFSQRLVNVEDLIFVGGDEIYLPACANHFSPIQANSAKAAL